MKICRRCLLKEMNEEQYRKVIEEGLSALPKEDLVAEDVVSGRLNVCKECEKLNMGTCAACGCYVEIRAALKKGNCPYKKW